MTETTTVTIEDVVAHYVREATAIIAKGEKPPIPGLMQAVLAAHPEITIDEDEFAEECREGMQQAVIAYETEIEEMARYSDGEEKPMSYTAGMTSAEARKTLENNIGESLANLEKAFAELKDLADSEDPTPGKMIDADLKVTEIIDLLETARCDFLGYGKHLTD